MKSITKPGEKFINYSSTIEHMVTTIQLHEKVKEDLSKLKEKNETYEDVIVKLVKEKKKKERELEQLYKEYNEEMGEHDLELAKEFETADNEGDPGWEW